MVPHVVRYLVGWDHRLVIPGSALCGRQLLLAGRHGRPGWPTTPFQTPVPVGVVTALFGVPFFPVSCLPAAPAEVSGRPP